MKAPKQKKIKLVDEVNRRRIELIVHAAFYVGFIASTKQRAITHQDNVLEIKRLVELIYK